MRCELRSRHRLLWRAVRLQGLQTHLAIPSPGAPDSVHGVRCTRGSGAHGVQRSTNHSGGGVCLGQSYAHSRRGSVLAQGGPAELKFPAQIFIGYIYCNYCAHGHLGGAFANFGSQVGFLCSDCAESDRIDYYALTSDHVRLMAHACVPSSSIAPTSRRFQPQVH